MSGDGFCHVCAYETCPRCSVCPMCGNGVEVLDGHDCVAATQDLRLQNDADWRAKVDYQKQLVGQLRAGMKRLRRAFGHMHQGPGDECRKCGLDLRDEIHTKNGGE